MPGFTPSCPQPTLANSCGFLPVLSARGEAQGKLAGLQSGRSAGEKSTSQPEPWHLGTLLLPLSGAVSLWMAPRRVGIWPRDALAAVPTCCWFFPRVMYFRVG